MVGVGKLEQFNRSAVFYDKRDEHAFGWTVGCNQNFPACQLGCKVTHLKGNMCHLPDQLGNRCVRFEAHPFHAILAILVPDNKGFHALNVVLSRPRLAGRNSNVMISTHFRSSVPTPAPYAPVTVGDSPIHSRSSTARSIAAATSAREIRVDAGRPVLTA